MSIPETIESFKEVLPVNLRKSINPELVKQITDLLSDPDGFHAYRDNLLGYVGVMADGKFKLTDYVSAVKYVSHKLMGATNIDAYIKTFPDRYQDMLARNVNAKDIHSYVSAYNKGKLVNLIYAQTMIPSCILNQDLYQRALNVQADLMVNANSELVRTQAANSILTQLKPPETRKLELDVSVKEDPSVGVLREAVLGLVAEQRKMLEAGALNAKDVAGQVLTIDAEPQP